jgi:NADH:ubiquinone oxidoreductase subunit C
MSIDRALDTFRELFISHPIDPQYRPIDDVLVRLPAAQVHLAVKILVEWYDVLHLSTLTGQDTEDEIELQYHFWDGRGLTLCTSLPRENARIATVTDLIPGAAFYEREVSEMLHVTFEGHPNPQPFLLPDDWNGEAPLRAEYEPPSLEHGSEEDG